MSETFDNFKKRNFKRSMSKDYQLHGHASLMEKAEHYSKINKIEMKKIERRQNSNIRQNESDQDSDYIEPKVRPKANQNRNNNNPNGNINQQA